MWITLGILIYIIFWLTCIASYTVHYLSDTIQITSFSQVLYTLSAGTEGAEGTVGAAVGGFFQSYWLLLIIATVILAYYIYLCTLKRKAKKAGVPFFGQPKYAKIFSCSVAGTALVISSLFGANLYKGWKVLGIDEYVENVNRVSELYDDNFVEPSDVDIKFPETKRNLIHIVVESMESSFTNKENGGGYQENLIPDLYKIAKAGTDFSPAGTKALNGAYVTNNSGWTVAGLVAMSAGLPLNVGNDSFNRNFNGNDKFLPHVEALGEILADNGYKNYFMCGSDGSFAGRSNYYEQHGNYEILDYAAAVNEKAIPEDYRVWWGFEDAKLFNWAEKKLTEISKEGEPFNFTLLTADTHFPDGYPCDKCENKYDTQYKNVIACTDRQIAAFIDWVSKQDFYKNTTIVINGDHLSMDGSVGKTAGKDYERKAFAAVLNGPEFTGKEARQFCTLDMFPTIVESLGAVIDGHRLGLGTSLYSDQKTLIERLGLRELNAELSADSKYYSEVIMSGDESKNEPKKEPEPAKEDSEASEEPAQEPVEAPVTNPIPPYYEQPAVKLENPDYVYTPEQDTSNDYTWTPPVQTPVYYPDPAPAPEPVVPVEPVVPEPVVPVEPVTPAPDPGTSTVPNPDPGTSIVPTPDPNPGTSTVPTPDPMVPSVPANPSGGETQSSTVNEMPVVQSSQAS